MEAEVEEEAAAKRRSSRVKMLNVTENTVINVLEDSDVSTDGPEFLDQGQLFTWNWGPV